MKTLLVATLFTVSLALPVYAAFPSKIPHPEGGQQTGFNGLSSPVRYSFKLHVTGYTLSELNLIAPEGMRLNQSIDIRDANGQIVPATIVLQGQVAKISFAQPVALNSKLSIDLNQVKTMGNNRIWELETSGKLGNLNADIPLQTIRLSPSISR